jgi:hypothetical protein
MIVIFILYSDGQRLSPWENVSFDIGVGGYQLLIPLTGS